ncbi:MAG TPA: hypothetical protein VF547_10020 [Allosphingosinicella sp.]|jgi:hypothetical protein
MARRVKEAAAAALILAGLSAPAPAQRAGGAVTAARADWADMAGGTYFGDLTSDARGTPRKRVSLAVAKIGPNQVRVTSDHPRLPAFTVRLIRAPDILRNADGPVVFLLDLSKSPRTLTVTVDGASWTGSRQ